MNRHELLEADISVPGARSLVGGTSKAAEVYHGPRWLFVSPMARLYLPFLLLAAVAGVAEASPPPEAQPEKLILGFERAELARGVEVSREEKPGKESWFYLLDRREGFDFAARFEWPGATNRAWTWHCRPGEHTEGEMALVASIGPANPRNRKATYRQTEFLSRFYPDTREGFEAHRLMTSFQWLTRADPTLRDWSGYERLWVDVRCETTAKLWLALEDDVIEPPVMRTYEIPKGRWVTLEVDLDEATRVRGLDLAKIANFWLLGRAPRRTELRVDNVRIVRRSTPLPERLLRDRTSMTVTVIRPERPQVPKLPAGLKPDRTPIQPSKPVVVARGSVVPFGWVSAYDNRILFVAYTAKAGSTAVAKAVYTDDGGRSWKPLPDPAARNLDHGTARGCAIDATGDGVAISSGPGCAGLGHANPRQHLTKYTFTGTAFKAESPTILDGDIRHCGSNASVVRLPGGPFRGRLWASWGEIGRAHRVGVHVKYSDDDGQTWVPWGKGALLPGSEATQWANGTYGYPETVITPYGSHVACFWRHKRGCGVLWSTFDGSSWTAPAEISPITLNGMDGAYRATMSAVTKGSAEVFFTATGLDTVLHFDGHSWSAAPIKCEDGGMLCLAGDVLTLFTAGKVNRRWKGLDWSRRTVLRYYRRSQNGQWEGPRDLTSEMNLHEYRSLAGYSVPPYAPANYVPFVFSDFDQGTVKLLMVPMK